MRAGFYAGPLFCSDCFVVTVDYLIVGLVSVIALAAHVALFRWVRFKVDEGVICKYLEDRNATSAERALSLPNVMAASEIAEKRFLNVCGKSGRMRLKADGNAVWLADSVHL
jgi:hypothetical protein